MSAPLTAQVATLAQRAVVRTLRQPAVIVPSLVFPLLLFGINAGGLQAASGIPGFPTDSYLDFILAFPLIQGALFGATTAGTDLARDIETGFLNRLALTPVRPAALLAALLTGVVALGALQAVVFLVVGVVAGVTIQAGVLGALVVVALATLSALGFGAIGAFMALRTGSAEKVQGLFPILFVLIFLSSVNLPRELIEVDWFRTVATYNPASYLVEGLRSLIITGWDGQALALGFGVAAATVAIGLIAASSALGSRLVRT